MTGYNIPGQTIPSDPAIAAETARAEAAEVALSARIAALETPPVPPVTPPSGKVVSITPATTLSQFLAIARDATVDVIQLGTGKYVGWRMGSGALNVVRTAAKPLTIQPAAGATANFDALNDGNSYGDPPFSLGTSQYVVFDARPGSILFSNYLVGQTGLFSLGGTGHCSFYSIKVRNCAAGGTSNGQSSHFAYMSSNANHLWFEGCDLAKLQPSDMTGTVTPKGGLNGFQMYNEGTPTAATNITIRNCTVADADWALVARDGTTGLTVDGLVVTNCGHGVPAAVDFGTNNTGTVTNSRSSASVGTPLILGKMTNGSGNGPWS